MDGGGFEPPKQFAADLQSVPFGHSGNHPYYILFSFYCFMQADDRTRTDNLLITNQLLCQLSHIGELLIRTLHTEWDLQGSNLWPSACKADALPAELRSRFYNMLWNDTTYAGSECCIKMFHANDPDGIRTHDLRRDRAAL